MDKCRQLGLGCDIIPKVEVGGITVSSTYIRRLVELGQVERATAVSGPPPRADSGGPPRPAHWPTIGIPTVNLTAPPHVLVPSHGVYATQVFLPDGSSHAGVTNVGTRPTVNNGVDVTVEAWLLDFDGDLYGQTVRVEFLQHLRDEVRFDSLDALRAQILRDAEETRQILAREQAR